MSEWFDAYTNPPPHDGSWIIAVFPDFSGMDFLSFRNGEWIDGGGGDRLFENENFKIQYSVWMHAPRWFRIWPDVLERNDLHARWSKSVLDDPRHLGQ